MNSKLLLLPVVLGGFLLAGCNLTGTTPAVMTPTASPEAMVQATPVVAMEKADFELTMGNYSFSEKTLTAKAGSTIIVKVTNNEGFHDFVIDELNVKSNMLKEGESQDLTITIPADAKGKTYAYYCGVGKHRAMGMEGKLIIE